jgi:hypothetical protein
MQTEHQLTDFSDSGQTARKAKRRNPYLILLAAYEHRADASNTEQSGIGSDHVDLKKIVHVLVPIELEQRPQFLRSPPERSSTAIAACESRRLQDTPANLHDEQ